tara:strand:- start:7561 stop:8493 length:933 start_codon:yes stop_codon:yes gene_type:complete
MYTDKFVGRGIKQDEMFIRDNLVMETLMGSQAYGCETKESDFDIVGIVMNPHQHLYPQQYGHILGFDDIPYFKNKDLKGEKQRIVLDNGKDLEGEWHSLTDFFFLAGMKGSPNMIENLFVNRNLITHHDDKISWMLRDNRKLFLSMKSFHAFKGYAFQQLTRSKKALKRWKETGKCDNTNRISSYEKYGMDVKMNYHPLRLLDSCDQIIKIGDLDLQRNKEECKRMRSGDWGTFEDFEVYVTDKIKELDKWVLSNIPAIPHVPAKDSLHNLLMQCIEEWYGSESKQKQQTTEYVSAKDVMDTLRRIEDKI